MIGCRRLILATLLAASCAAPPPPCPAPLSTAERFAERDEVLQFVFEVRRSDAVVSRPTIRVLSGTDANVSLGSEGSQFSITFESVRAQSLIGMRGEVLVDAERHPLSMEFPIGTSTEIPLPGSEFRIWVVATVAKVDA